MRAIKTAVSRYFFTPVQPYSIALFRIAFGLCVMATLLLLHADWLDWFGMHGWIPMETIRKAESGFRLNLFAWIPQNDDWIGALYWLLLGSSIALTLGFCTRLSSVIVFLGLNSINQRMPLILHGGDTFLRSASFFLMFSKAGSAISVDRAIARYRQTFTREYVVPPISAWPQRLIECQLAIIYLSSFWWKIKGETWRNGTALFYIMNLREIRKFPAPHFLHTSVGMRAGTWFALVFELAFPLFIWFKPARRPLLLLGVAFHLSLEYLLNIPMFQWDMLSAYILFVNLCATRHSLLCCVATPAFRPRNSVPAKDSARLRRKRDEGAGAT